MTGRRDAAERMGAVAVDPTETSVVDRVSELTGGGASYAIDTTAISEVVKQAQQSLRVARHAGGARPGRRGVRHRRDRPAPDRQGDPVLDRGRLRPPGDGPAADRDERGRRTSRRRPDHDLPVRSEINDAVADVLAGKVVKPVLVW